MAKKTEIQKISPSVCLRSLEAYNEAIFMLTSMLPAVIKYIKDTPNDNKDYQNKVLEILEKNKENIDSFLIPQN